MTNGITLLPCPFCGSEDLYVTHTRYYDSDDTVCVFCNSCKTVVTLEANEAEGLGEAEKRRAVAAWNSRAESTCTAHIGDGDTRGWWVCDSCGDLFDSLSALACKKRKAPNYCPNCGAKVVDDAES